MSEAFRTTNCIRKYLAFHIIAIIPENLMGSGISKSLGFHMLYVRAGFRFKYGRLAQLQERHIRSVEVRGSDPLLSTKKPDPSEFLLF